MFILIGKRYYNSSDVSIFEKLESGLQIVFKDGSSIDIPGDNLDGDFDIRRSLCEIVPALPGYYLISPVENLGTGHIDFMKSDVVAFYVDRNNLNSDPVYALAANGMIGPEGDVGILTPSGQVIMFNCEFSGEADYVRSLLAPKAGN